MPEHDEWAYERDVLTRPLTPEGLELEAAYNWCLREPWIQERHLGEIVVAQKGKIWGAGRTRKEAWQAALAQPGCPEKRYLVCVMVPGYVVPDVQPQQEGIAP